MSAKILWPLGDLFRTSPLRGADALTLSLQLLAWARLSARGTIAPPLQLGRALARGSNGLLEGLKALEKAPSPIAQAFTGASIHAGMAGSALQSASDLCAKLEADGLLDSFLPEDAAADLGFDAQHFWPTIIEPTLADLMVRLADPGIHDSVYCAWDATAQIAGRLVRAGCNVWTENPVATPFPALAALFADRSIEIGFSDPIRSPSFVSAGRLRKFDRAIALPPMGVKIEASIVSKDLFARFSIPKATWGVLTVQHLLAQAEQTAVIAVPNSLLLGVGADRLLREQLVRSGQLSAVVSLPPGLLSGTNLQIALLVLAPKGGIERVRFVNASGDEFRESPNRSRTTLTKLDRIVENVFGDEDGPIARTVERVDIEANDLQLLVGRYVLDPTQQKLKSRLVNVPRRALGDLVETVRPLAASPQQTDSAIAIREVGTSDIPAAGYMRPGRELYAEPEVITKGANQFLRPQDIVLTIRGSTGKVGIVPDDVPDPGADGWIAGSSATVLRMGPNSRIDPRALIVLLRSPMGQDLLKTITSGNTIPMITLRDLLRLEIPVPSLESAQRAAALLDKEQALQDQIEALQRKQTELAGSDWTLGMLD